MERLNILFENINYKNFIKKYPDLQQESKELLEKFISWYENPCHIEDSFYNKKVTIPIYFNKIKVPKNEKKISLNTKLVQLKINLVFQKLIFITQENILNFQIYF